MSNLFLSLVIDADIARSSGTSEHPVSSGARKLLDSVSKNGHVAVMCPTLCAEWKKHRSRYATKWMASMVAKKKLLFIKPNEEVKNFVEVNIVESKQKEIASKDSHLVDAALFTDKIIVSNDDRARHVFCQFSLQYGLIKTVSWFNSVRDKDFLIQNLVKNNFIPDIYFLGS